MFPAESLNQAESGGGGNRTRVVSPPKPRSQAKTGWVYLIDDGGWSYKIGWAKDPQKRLVGLQTSHPEELRLVAVVEGTVGTERELHELFAGLRVRGEWFQKHREILGYFEDVGFVCVCRRTVDPDCFIHGDGPAW